MQLLNPLTVQDVGLPPGHVLEMASVDQVDVEASGLEDLIDGDPIDASRFHGHGLNLARLQPVGQGVEVDGEGGEDAHRLLVTINGDASVDLFGPDIQPSGMEVDLAHYVQLWYVHS
jgi:hypothetical protein